MSVHFSSATDLWATPQAYFDKVAAEHGPFGTDVCALPSNAKAPRYFTPEVDGLAQDWTGVCLVPARTDTAWWHDYAAKGSVTFIRGRLKFGDATNSAPFPSALVVFELGVSA